MEKAALTRELALRLPRYFRVLRQYVIRGRQKVSSGELSGQLGITASQVRRDLGCLGLSGQNGYGYSVKELHDALGEELGVFGGRTAIIIGAGHLGHALAAHRMFVGRGFTLIGVFDRDPAAVGRKIADLSVLPMDRLAEFCRTHHPHIALLAVDAKNAQDAAQAVCACGIKGLLNFTETELDVPEQIPVESVHVGDMLYVLSQRISDE